MTRLSVLVGLAAACSLPLSSAPSWAQDVEVVANVPVVSTEGPAPHPDGSVYFTDLANDRILRLGTDGMISTFRQPANRPNGLRLDAELRLLAAEQGDPQRNTAVQHRRTTFDTVENSSSMYSRPYRNLKEPESPSGSRPGWLGPGSRGSSSVGLGSPSHQLPCPRD